MTFELFDFGEETRVKPPHTCSVVCGSPCASYVNVKEIEDEIEERRAALNDSLIRYRELKTNMNHVHDSIINRAPLEIVMRIFALCLPRHWYGLLRNSPPAQFEGGNAHALFTLGAVCKTWRQLLWSAPPFWSHLSIALNRYITPVSIEIVQEWLDRAQQAPLSVAIRWQGGSPDSTQLEKLAPLCKIINATSSRWEYLDLRMPGMCLGLFSGSPANLRELRVSNTNPTTNDKHLGSFTASNRSKPLPTFVALDFVRLKSIDIAWNNVTHFESIGLKIVDVLELLRQAPSITDCSFFMADISDLSRSEPVIHNSLKNLRVLLPTSPCPISLFLDKLTLLNLEFLSIRLNQMLPANSLISLLERSSCPLNTLSIDAALKEEALLSCLRALPPTVRQLFISPNQHGECPPKNLFKLIAHTSHKRDDGDDSMAPSDENFLPMLKELSFATVKAKECEEVWDIIPDMFGVPDDFNPNVDSAGEDSLALTRSFDTLSFYYEPLRRTVNLDVPPWVAVVNQPDSPAFISRPTLDRMERLIDLGIDIDIALLDANDANKNQNFITNSIEHHQQGVVLVPSVMEA